MNESKEPKDLSCESKLMTPQSWACPSHERNIEMVVSGSSKKFPIKKNDMTYILKKLKKTRIPKC